MIPFNCLTVPLGKGWYYDLSDCLDEYTKLESIEGVECGKCSLLKTQRLLNVILERIQDSPADNQVQISTLKRLQTISETIENDDYDDKTLTEKCNLPSKNRMTTTKSRQAVIARPPKSLAVHVNRSLFDETTGELKKNYAEVRFPKTLDLGPWCIGSTGTADSQLEEWLLDPTESMIAGSKREPRSQGPIYELRAVVTHYGRHENGHYICYRKHPVVNDIDEKNPLQEQWWRLSDEDVMKVTEDNVLSQGGVFMIFYDRIEPASVPPFGLANAVTSETFDEAAVAASIPLPTDSDDCLGSPDVDDQESCQFSREQSITKNVSDLGDEPLGEEEKYSPTKAILIPARVQSSIPYHHKGTKKRAMGSIGNMVMV